MYKQSFCRIKNFTRSATKNTLSFSLLLYLCALFKYIYILSFTKLHLCKTCFTIILYYNPLQNTINIVVALKTKNHNKSSFVAVFFNRLKLSAILIYVSINRKGLSTSSQFFLASKSTQLWRYCGNCSPFMSLLSAPFSSITTKRMQPPEPISRNIAKPIAKKVTRFC